MESKCNSTGRGRICTVFGSESSTCSAPLWSWTYANPKCSTLIPNKYRHREEWGGGGKESEEEAAFLWAQELYSTDRNKTSLKGECTSDATDCALEWANEANKWVCDYVLKDDIDGVQRGDLADDYYEDAAKIVNAMIRKGGRRLAAWVNMMADEAERKLSEGQLEMQELR